MIVSAYDPGRVTGYAKVETGVWGEAGGFPLLYVETRQIDTIDDVWYLATHDDDDIEFIVIEDFVGSGPRTPDAVHTLKLVGLLQYGLADLCKIVMHPPQYRKAYVAQARKLLDARHRDRHGADALAHVLCFLDRWKA